MWVMKSCFQPKSRKRRERGRGKLCKRVHWLGPGSCSSGHCGQFSSIHSTSDDLCKLTMVTAVSLSGIHSEMNRPMLIWTIKRCKEFGDFWEEVTLSALDENKDTFSLSCYRQHSCYHRKNQSSHEAITKSKLEGQKKIASLLTVVQKGRI